MGLKSKFKSSAKAATEGVWFDYPDAANSDGSVPGFKLARISPQNKRYSMAFREMTKGIAAPDGTFDADSITEQQAEEITVGTFVSAVLLDWRNVEPADDGKKVTMTPEAATALLADPDWSDLWLDLQAKAKSRAPYQPTEGEAKN